MDAFVAEMSQVSISRYHTPNTLNVKEYQATSPLASVAAYEPVTKQSITFDDLLNSNSLMAASLKQEYEAYRAAAGKQAGGVTFDQYKEGIQYSRGFDYRSIKDKQLDKEFWVNLGIGAAVIILTIACPPAGIAAGAAYGAMQLADAATGMSLISGRKLSTEERVTEGVFGVLDAVPAFKAAGAFSAIGRMGTKSVTTLGDLTKTMGRASGRRLIQLKQVSRAGLDSVKQAAANTGVRISLSGLQPEFAGASGVGSGESLIQDVKNTFRQMASKEIDSSVSNTDKIGTSPRYGDRRISDEQYKKLRGKTPSQELQDKVNEDVELPMDDPVLPGKIITKKLEPDHIVSMDKISRMEGFDRLTEKQQLEVLNNPKNFIGLSRAANGSKQDKSYEEWTHYKKGKPGEIEIEPTFRDKMIKKENELEKVLQKQIDDLVGIKDRKPGKGIR